VKEPEVDALEAALSDDDRAFLDQLADGIAGRRLTAAVLFFLESIKPLNFVTAQAMVVLRPVVSIIWSDPVRFDRVQRLLEQRGGIELLLRRLEARA
jgi:hypothetical protein